MKAIIVTLFISLLFTSSFQHTPLKMGHKFEKLIEEVRRLPMKKVSVAAAADDNVLAAIHEAKEQKIADAILVGDKKEIEKIGKQLGMDISSYEIIDEPDPIKAAHIAVQLVHDGKADMYMKGLINTKDFLKSILDKKVGLRTGNPLSHVCLFEIQGVEKLLFLTDVAFISYPTLEDKIHIIQNTIKVCNACGIQNPKIAPLAAVEVLNPKMPVTVEAKELTKMNEEGKIKGCIIDGPLSLDMAISREACVHKNALNRKIVGDADVLLFPDIHAGNIAYKFLVHTTVFKNGCILTGTKSPAILTSRSDSIETKLNSIATASVVAEHLKSLK